MPTPKVNSHPVEERLPGGGGPYVNIYNFPTKFSASPAKKCSTTG